MSRDLDQMIKNFQGTNASPEQLLTWSLAAQESKLRRKTWLRIGGGIAAGLLLGFLLTRSFYFQTETNEPNFVATFAQVTVKSM